MSVPESSRPALSARRQGAPGDRVSCRHAADAAGVVGGLDLARLLIPDPRCSLLLRVCGDSMLGVGIHHGDLLVVERQPSVPSGAIVVARLGGGFTLKRLCRRGGRCWLEAAHPAYPPLDLEATGVHQGLDSADVQIWGVAVHVIHSL